MSSAGKGPTPCPALCSVQYTPVCHCHPFGSSLWRGTCCMSKRNISNFLRQVYSSQVVAVIWRMRTMPSLRNFKSMLHKQLTTQSSTTWQHQNIKRYGLMFCRFSVVVDVGGRPRIKACATLKEHVCSFKHQIWLIVSAKQDNTRNCRSSEAMILRWT